MAEHPAVEFLTAAWERAEELVRVISHGGYEPQTWHVQPSRSWRWVQVISKSRTLGEPPEAAMRDDDQPVMLVQAGRNEHLHAVMHDPAAVQRRVAAERALLADFQAERHLVVDDPWYTCAAATEESDGARCMDDTRRGGPCDCGRDTKVARRVRLLAQAWGWPGE